MPWKKRKYIYPIYAFARFADDIADSSVFTKDEKIQKLNNLESILDFPDESIIDSEIINIIPALTDAINVLNLPVKEFKNLLYAFKNDALNIRYNSFDELINYSIYSANPIGHLVLIIFGYSISRNKEIFEYSDYICTALQLTNFWQDVKLDVEINRIYIPEYFLNKYNYDNEYLVNQIENDNFKDMIKELVELTYELFLKGSKIISFINGGLKIELSAIYNGGVIILKKIKKNNFCVLSNRPVLNKKDFGLIFSYALMGKLLKY